MVAQATEHTAKELGTRRRHEWPTVTPGATSRVTRSQLPARCWFRLPAQLRPSQATAFQFRASGHHGGRLVPRWRALLLSLGQASVAEFRRRTPARDEDQAQRALDAPLSLRLADASVKLPSNPTLEPRPTRARRPAHHACSLLHRCRRRLSDTYRRRDVANRVPNGCGVDATARPRPASFSLTARSTSPRIRRAEPSGARSHARSRCGARPGQGILGRAGCALPLVAGDRLRDHVARAVLLSGR
jgi:hypothetical protein